MHVLIAQCSTPKLLFVQFHIYVNGSAPHADQLVPT